MTQSISWIDTDRFRSLVQRVRVPEPKPEPPSQKGVIALPPLKTSGRNIEDRVAELVDWVDQGLDCQAIFVTDEHGLAVLNRRTEPAQIVISATLMAALQYVDRELNLSADRIMVSLDDTAMLSLMATSTTWGRFALGVVSEETLPDALLRQLQIAFKDTMELSDEH